MKLMLSAAAVAAVSGTPTAPIVFSSLDNNFTGAGEWGRPHSVELG